MGMFDFSFSDPQSMYPLLGLIQGLGQAAQPSRLPVPMGSVLGSAASGLMQGQQAQQAYKDNQLDTQAKQQTIDFNKFKMAQQKAQINAGRKLVGLPELTDEDFAKGNFNGQAPLSAPAPMQTAPAPSIAPQPAANNLDSFYANFIAPHEGGYNANDGNGKPVNFGINQGANPDIDVKNLTPEKAKQIYQDRYFGPSGATAAQGPMQAILADTAINMGNGAAKDLLAQSGGDPQKYLDMRDARYQQIAQANPAKAAYLPGWLKRTQDLRQYIAQNGQQQAPEQVAQAPVPAPQAAAAPSGGLEIPDELKQNPVFRLAASSGDMDTVYKMLQAHQTYLTPDEKKARGYSPADVVVHTIEGDKKISTDTSANKWMPLTDPTNNTQYRYNPDTAQSTTLDGKPYSPGGAQKLGGAAQQEVKLSPQERSSMAAQVASGQPVMQILPGYGRNLSQARLQARQDAIDLIKTQNPGMTDSQAGVELANRAIEYQSGKKSSGQLTQMLGATKQAVAQLDFNITKTKEEMAKLPSTDLSPILNAVARGEEKWTGNPAYSGLFYYMHATAVESARILSGGQSSSAQLHQGAMEEAQKWANMNMTPASFEEVANAMHEEGNNRVQTYEDALKGQRVGHESPAATKPPPAADTGKKWPAPPPQAIQMLKMKKDKANFDAMFGPGAADRALNGR